MRLDAGTWFHLSVAAGAALFAAAALTLDVYGHDPSMYLGLATSIADGQGYVVDGRTHTQYPPGLPLLMAAVLSAGGDQLTIQRSLAFLGPLTALLTFVWLRGHAERTATALLVLGSAELFEQSVIGLRSEPLYLTTTVGLFCVLGRPGPVSVGRWLLVAALAAFAVATRTVGLALIAAAGAMLLQRLAARRAGDRTPTSLLLAVLVGGALAATAWWTWTLQNAAPLYEGDMHYSYGAQFRLVDPHQLDRGLATAADIGVRIPSMLGIQLTHGAELTTNIGWLMPAWSSPLIVGSVLSGLTGIVGALRGKEALAAWYVLAFGAALSLWPYDEGTRFVLPVLPWLMFFILRGARGLGAWWRSTTASARRRALLSIGLGGITVWAVEMALTDRTIGRQGVAGLVTWILLALAAFGSWARTGAPGTRALRRLLALAATTYLAVGASTAWRTWAREAGPSASTQRLNGLSEAAAWLRDHAAAGSSVMCEQYAAVHFATGLHTMPIPRTARADALQAAMLAGRPGYLIVQRRAHRAYYLPVEERRFEILKRLFPAAFRMVLDYEGGRILECTLER